MVRALAALCLALLVTGCDTMSGAALSATATLAAGDVRVAPVAAASAPAGTVERGTGGEDIGAVGSYPKGPPSPPPATVPVTPANSRKGAQVYPPPIPPAASRLGPGNPHTTDGVATAGSDGTNSHVPGSGGHTARWVGSLPNELDYFFSDDPEDRPASSPTAARGKANPPSPLPKQTRKNGQYDVVRVFFGTDRSVSAGAQGGWTFGSQRAQALAFGSVDVSIPPRHVTGIVESPPLWRLDARRDPQHDVTVLRLAVTSYDQFRAEMRS